MKISISVLKKKVKAVYNSLIMEQWNYKVFWDEALKQIHQFLADNDKLMDAIWFTSLEYKESQANTIVVSVPSNFFRDQLRNKGYINLIENTIFGLLGQPIKLDFVIQSKQQNTSQNSFTANSSITTQSQIQSQPETLQIRNTEVQQQNFNPFRQTINDNQPVFQKQESITTPTEEKPFQETKIQKHPDLTERYTFENFVPGGNSDFCYNASLVVAKNPGKTNNPLLIYGGVGLGKTHLMQAIGNYIYKDSERQGKKTKIICISAENFTNEFVTSLHSNGVMNFKNKFRNADVLLIDDIHFFQNKDGTQEELFHTFNHLYERNKQMVFTCDRPPKELKNLTDRLQSRFTRGLMVDLAPPIYETRRAIIEKKLTELNISLPADVIEYIAQSIQTNVRDLESSINTVATFKSIQIEMGLSPEITVEKTKELLQKHTTFTSTANVNIENIIKIVANHYNLSENDIVGQKRSKNIMLPRQIAMYIAREMTEYSTTELGMEFGGRDHSTVMHSCQKIESLIDSDPSLENTIEALMNDIKNYKK